MSNNTSQGWNDDVNTSQFLLEPADSNGFHVSQPTPLWEPCCDIPTFNVGSKFCSNCGMKSTGPLPLFESPQPTQPSPQHQQHEQQHRQQPPPPQQQHQHQQQQQQQQHQMLPSHQQQQQHNPYHHQQHLQQQHYHNASQTQQQQQQQQQQNQFSNVNGGAEGMSGQSLGNSFEKRSSVSELEATICGMCGTFSPEGTSLCNVCGAPCRPAEASEVPDSYLSVLTRMRDMQLSETTFVDPYLIDKSWWVGTMERTEAESQLNQAEAGAFVIRQSGIDGTLTLTVKSTHRCKHYQLVEADGFIRIQSSRPTPKYESLRELLIFYHQTTILSGLSLMNPDVNNPIGSMNSASAMSSSNHSKTNMNMNTNMNTNTNGNTNMNIHTHTNTNTNTNTQTGRMFNMNIANSMLEPVCNSCNSPLGPAATFCRTCGAKTAEGPGIHMQQQQLLQPTPAIKRVGVNALESVKYRSLADDVNGCSRLYNLIAMGCDILEAEKSNVLFEGELQKLRGLYRIRRTMLQYGCLKTAWAKNKSTDSCGEKRCQTKFSATVRRHHCRCCGKVICKACAANKFNRVGLSLNKVCPTCFEFLSMVATGRVRQAVEQFRELEG